MNVLVVGAPGTLGSLVGTRLASRHQRVIPLSRSDGDLRDPAVIAQHRADVIINCAGASVAVGLGHGWRGYGAVDVPIGMAAVEAARRTGARLVYVGVAHAPELARCAYVAAHEKVAAATREIGGATVRSTGFYSAFAALLPLARRGCLFDIGKGAAKSNPICEDDLAQLVVGAAIDSTYPIELSCGGPETMSRRELFEVVATAAGRHVRIVSVPRWLARLGNAGLCIAHPRIGQFVQFAAELAVYDNVAPIRGSTTLANYLRAQNPIKAIREVATAP